MIRRCRARIRTFAGALALVSLSFSLAACSTHDARFNALSPRPVDPRELEPPTTEQLRTATDRLLQRGLEAENASPEALAALTEAAAARVRAEPTRAARAALTDFADQLLAEQTDRDGRFTERALEERTTALRSGLALLTAHEVTGREPYARAARQLAAEVPTDAFGWETTPRGAVIAQRSATGAPSAPDTALAAALLTESAADRDPAQRANGVRAFAEVLALQVAPGRWWGDRVTERPMTIDGLATTLMALDRIGTPQAQRILKVGVPNMQGTAFDGRGQRLPNGFALDPEGHPLAVAIISEHLFRTTAGGVLRKAYVNLRPDGTVGFAKADNDAAQAKWALAFATAFAQASKRPASSVKP